MNSSLPVSMSGLAVAHPRNPRLPIVRGVKWDVAPGECWVLTGLLGSGKTVLLEAAAGLHPILAGQLRLFGQVYSEGEAPQLELLRRRFGVVFDGPGRLFPGLNVWENITLPLRYHENLDLREASNATAPIIELLELGGIAGQATGRLSRAWSRRVALARALVLKPEVLLLDNPLTGLDPTHVRWWRGLLGSFLEGHPFFEGVPRTVLIAGDELRPLLPLGDHFAIVHEGQMRALGDRKKVLASADPFVKDLLDEDV